jgi:hypothetical protein
VPTIGEVIVSFGFKVFATVALAGLWLFFGCLFVEILRTVWRMK